MSIVSSVVVTEKPHTWPISSPYSTHLPAQFAIYFSSRHSYTCPESFCAWEWEAQPKKKRLNFMGFDLACQRNRADHSENWCEWTVPKINDPVEDLGGGMLANVGKCLARNVP